MRTVTPTVLATLFGLMLGALAHARGAGDVVRIGVLNDMSGVYLKAVDKVGQDTDGKVLVAAMKAIPTDDPLFGSGSIRPDGRKIHPMYLFQVKTPAESKGAWDIYKLVATIPADEAFRPLREGGCTLVTQ
jgi:branched-chain amino acid transport system substrate-binding protein